MLYREYVPEKKQLTHNNIDLCLFPGISTGLGISWFYDLLVYYVLFFSLINFKNYKENKCLFIVLISLTLSLLYPLINSPSIETKIMNEEDVFIKNTDISSITQQNNTFLELEDLNYLYEKSVYENQDTIKNEVNNLAKILKGINYPGEENFYYLFIPILNITFLHSYGIFLF